VLLLNASLTVRASQANSHSTIGWEKFTDAIIDHVNSKLTGVVFLLWGAFAGKKGARINKVRFIFRDLSDSADHPVAKTKHLILTSPHPSPLSAYRGFIGNNHFKLANAFLEKNGKEAVDWAKLP
jgi:uracil-DNA glycosylase